MFIQLWVFENKILLKSCKQNSEVKTQPGHPRNLKMPLMRAVWGCLVVWTVRYCVDCKILCGLSDIVWTVRHCVDCQILFGLLDIVWTVRPCVEPMSCQNVTDCAVSTLLKLEFGAVKFEINGAKKTLTDWFTNSLALQGIPHVFGLWGFTTIFTTAHKLSLSLVTLIQYMPSKSV
jgi:hypothetical protein